MGLEQVTKLDLQSIDHIVLQAVNVPETIKFYTKILGMTHNEFQPPAGGAMRQSLHFGAQKINLHDVGSPFQPHARNPTAGSVDLCFITQRPLSDWQQHLTNCGIVIEDGPVSKTGANGPFISLYSRSRRQSD